MIAKQIASALFVSGVVGATALACGGSNPSSGFDFDGGSGDEDAGDILGSSSGGSSSGGFANDGGSGISPDAACATVTSKAEQQPLDIYIMLDQSASMSEDNKWPSCTGALTQFLHQPSLNGVSVGIQYFGLPPSKNGNCPTQCSSNNDCGPNGPCVVGQCLGCVGGLGADSCDATDYAKPEVEIAQLPGASQTLIQSINGHKPQTSTPTSAALQGAVNHAKDWAQSHPGHTVIALFATDGDPTECDQDLGNIDAIAAAAANGTPKVLTFVIGVGSSLTALDGIAKAGGTTKAYMVDTSSNVNQQFLDALNKIRGTAAGCTYQLPAPQNGASLDFGAVNVQYTPSGGGTPQTLPKVADKAHCPATGNAWYYDNNAAPTKIILCDTSCNTVMNDLQAQMNIIVGCASVVK